MHVSLFQGLVLKSANVMFDGILDHWSHYGEGITGLGTYNLKLYVRLEAVKLGICFVSLMLSVSTPVETLMLHDAVQSVQIQLKDRGQNRMIAAPTLYTIPAVSFRYNYR